MSDLIHRAQQAKRVIADESLPKPQQAWQALQAFSGLVLSDLEKSVRDQFEADLAPVNAVLGRYSLKESDDYRDLRDADLNEMLALVGAAAAHAIDAETHRIVAALESPVGKLPEDAIRESREHRELMVPRLIQVLQDAVATARRGEKPKSNAHFLALFLLTEFKASEAFTVILEALTLPGELPDDLFGDAIHELPPRMFAIFLGDNIEAIEAIIDDRSLEDTLRWGAAHSYLHLVHDGRMSRDDAVGRLQRHLRQAIDNKDNKIGTGLVCELADYAPAEALDDIREAYERGLVDTSFIGLRDVEESIAEGESRLRKELAHCESPDVDTLDELRTWASFRDKTTADVDRPTAPLTRSSTALTRSPTAPVPHFATRGELLERAREPIGSRQPRVGRNDPCPCGSGNKFKKCCGART
jgi:hypothetical protein